MTIPNNFKPLIDAIVADYARFSASTLTAAQQAQGAADDVLQAKHDARVAEFRAKLSITFGKRYARIVSDGSAWGFVALEDINGKITEGSILKAKGWATPTLNAARGNILTGDLSWVRWTGPAYLV